MTKVSVVIPTYNEEKDIGDCLLSLGKQTEPLEIVVVDDGSSDNTVSVVNEYASQDENNSRLFKQIHKGAGAARNLGVSKAKGETVVFVDADMTFDKDFIKNLIQPIKDGKTIGTFSKEEYLANKDNIWAVFWNINRGLPKDRMLPDNYPNNQKVFRAITKKAFLDAGGFDESAGYTDDWSLAKRLNKLALNATGAIFYHKNPASLTEVFHQAKWMGKRKYKLGVIGFGAALARASLPVSLILSLVNAIKFRDVRYTLFKTVYDSGVFLGILSFALTKSVSK